MATRSLVWRFIFVAIFSGGTALLGCAKIPDQRVSNTSSRVWPSPDVAIKGWTSLQEVEEYHRNISPIALMSGEERSSVRVVEAAFMDRLIRNGIVVVTRSDIRAMLREIAFQNGGTTSRGDRRNLGKVYNISALLVYDVEVSKLEGANARLYGCRRGLHISAKIIDLETLEVLRSSGDGPACEADIGTLAQEVAFSLLPRPRINIPGELNIPQVQRSR